MRSKMKLYTAALVAVILGLPLAEQTRADDYGAWDITSSAIGLAAAITSAAIGWS